jgi:uncharacterized protein YbjT (DUF2867 family)
VAAVCLTRAGHAGRSYTLTGPEARNLYERADALSAALGRRIQVVGLTEEQARAEWEAHGYSPEMIDFFFEMSEDSTDEDSAPLPTVREVTGRPGRTFAQWAAENAHHFR